MFKLVVVGGPSKGSSYSMKSGEMSVGRVAGNDIVLSSQRVSKKHCVLVVNNDSVTVKDAGSSNGTFVNGILTKMKKLMPGDRVSVGEFVLELREGEVARPKPAMNMGGNVVPFQVPGGAGLPGMAPAGLPGTAVPGGIDLAPPPGVGGAAAGSLPNAAAPPKDLKEKIKFYFEQYIINFVYNLNEQYEWRVMMAGLIGILAVCSTILSVYPVLERVRVKLANEASRRALMLGRLIVERNAPLIYERLESKTDVSFAEKEEGVLSAYLIDMEGRVIAPGRKMNQYLSEPTEAAFSAAAREVFLKRDDVNRYVRPFGKRVAVAVPLKLFNANTGKNVSVALALVYFDRGMILFDPGTEALSYIQALILIGIVCVIIYFTLYRLTLRPLTALNDEMDQVLKGNGVSVGKKFKMSEISPLIDLANTALQRAGAGSGGDGLGGAADNITADDVVNMLKFTAERMSNSGMIIFSGDRRILHISPFMEEITGIRADSAVGAGINDVARDAAFVSFVDDILTRAPLGGVDGVSEDFEFSGTSYKMECLGFGSPGNPKAYSLTAVKAET